MIAISNEKTRIDFSGKNTERFFRKKHGAIFTKKTRSVYVKLITCAHVHQRTPRRQPYLRTGFFIAIRFSQKNRGAFFLEKTQIDQKIKNGSRFFGSDFDRDLISKR
jgi:hypothetical protein